MFSDWLGAACAFGRDPIGPMPPDMGAVVDFEICLEWESSSAEVGLADLPLEDWIGASKDPKPERLGLTASWLFHSGRVLGL